MITVALIGPDGCGKTTVSTRLQDQLPVRAKCLYMGMNHEASQHLLPTTWMVQKLRRLTGKKRDAGGPRDKKVAPTDQHVGLGRRVWKSVKSSISLLNRLAEEWYRQLIAWYYLRRGWIVMFDRHFFADYYAYDIADHLPRTLTQRIHGLILNRFYPRPDFVVFLDAPAEVLFQRKGEGTVELLNERRADYLQIKDLVKRFEIVDANRDIDEVVEDVRQRITDYCDQLKQEKR